MSNEAKSDHNHEAPLVVWNCGSCGRELAAPISKIGKHSKCSHCDYRQVVPSPEDATGELPRKSKASQHKKGTSPTKLCDACSKDIPAASTECIYCRLGLDTIVVQCSGCRKTYAIGQDADVATWENLVRDFQEMPLLGPAPSSRTPDIVDASHMARFTDKTTLQLLKDFRRRKETREWKCHACGAVQLYNWCSLQPARKSSPRGRSTSGQLQIVSESRGERTDWMPFIDALIEQFGNFTLHALAFAKAEQAFRYLHSLSFVDGERAEVSVSADRMQAQMIRAGCTEVLLGGRFTQDEIAEVRDEARKQRQTVNSYAAGDSEQRQLEAATDDEPEVLDKRWWEFWK